MSALIPIFRVSHLTLLKHDHRETTPRILQRKWAS